MSLRNKLQKWQAAGVIDAAAVERIMQHEQGSGGLRFVHAMLAIGALAIVLGMAAIISTNWDFIPPAVKLVAHILLNLLLAGGAFYAHQHGRNAAREICLFLLAGFNLTLLALIGQIYQTQSPTWQALTLWLMVISPFLFVLARARFTVVCWCVAFMTTLLTATSILYQFHLLSVVTNFLPLAFLLAGQLVWLRKIWPVWPRIFAAVGYLLLVFSAMTAQMFWRIPLADMTMLAEFPIGLGIFFWPMLVAAGLLMFARHKQKLIALPTSLDLLPVVSVVLIHLPWLFLHPEWPVLGAALFMAYWAFLGWVGVQSGYRWLLSLAVVVISIRLVVVYVEIFGSLLQTGVGLIVSGVLLIGLVLAARKLLRRLVEKAGQAS
jgi:uncharacterized membrane protein